MGPRGVVGNSGELLPPAARRPEKVRTSMAPIVSCGPSAARRRASVSDACASLASLGYSRSPSRGDIISPLKRQSGGPGTLEYGCVKELVSESEAQNLVSRGASSCRGQASSRRDVEFRSRTLRVSLPLQHGPLLPKALRPPPTTQAIRRARVSHARWRPHRFRGPALSIPFQQDAEKLSFAQAAQKGPDARRRAMQAARRTWSVHRSAARARQRCRWAFFSGLLETRTPRWRSMVLQAGRPSSAPLRSQGWKVLDVVFRKLAPSRFPPSLVALALLHHARCALGGPRNRNAPPRLRSSGRTHMARPSPARGLGDHMDPFPGFPPEEDSIPRGAAPCQEISSESGRRNAGGVRAGGD